MPARRGGGTRKALAWVASVPVLLAISAGVGGAQLVAAAAFPRTLMRSRGQVTVEIDGAASDGELVAITMGLIVQGSAVGLTGRGPFSQGDADWLWWGSVTLSGEGVTEGNASSGRIARLPVDSKAMRKVNPDEALIFVMENTSIGAAAAVNMVGGIRFLFGT